MSKKIEKLVEETKNIREELEDKISSNSTPNEGLLKEIIQKINNIESEIINILSNLKIDE